MIIYTWCILERQVPDFSNGKICAKNHIRLGRSCTFPVINNRAPKPAQKMRHASLAVRGPQLFNVLPQEVRNRSGCSVEAFKKMLDSYLATVPDEPQIQGYTLLRRADSNSLLDMVRFAKAP